MKVFVVIPAYQAEATIFNVVSGLKPYVNDVVVVNDGSTDKTASLASEAKAVVINHLVNRGYGAALVTGNLYALQQGAQAVVHFDADGQFDPADVPKLINSLIANTPSVALGSRFLGKVVNIPALRLLILKLGILFTWATSGLKLTDTHNGLRALTAEAVRLMNLKQDRMAVSSEIVQEIARNKISYKEVPVTVIYSKQSLNSSKQGTMPAVKIVKDLVIGKLLR